MIGRAGSRGFPNKNIANVLGRKLCEYPLLAAKKSRLVENIYVTTNCPKIKKITSEEKNFRNQNLDFFKSVGFPNKRLEDWKFSDFKDIINKNFEKLDVQKSTNSTQQINLLHH